MRLFIPTIGTQLRLVADWTCALVYDRRNTDMIEALEHSLVYKKIKGETFYGKPASWQSIDFDARYPMTLPEGTVLRVDRIYIRKGASDFDSLTFWINETAHPLLYNKKRRRFFSSLDEVNTMDCEVVR